LPFQGSRQVASGLVIADPHGEVGHVLVPDAGREGVDADQVRVIEVDGCLAVDTGIGSPQHDLSGLRIDQPAMLVIGLVAKSSSDLLQVQAAQVKHRITIARQMWPAAATAWTSIDVTALIAAESAIEERSVPFHGSVYDVFLACSSADVHRSRALQTKPRHKNSCPRRE
jgi:hypothetical protein